MVELTSGFVAGIIAAVLLVARIFFPTALSFVLAGQLKDGETAATWTAASAPLQASFWPFWLRSDQVQSHGVRKSVTVTTFALPTLAVLTALSSVVTPLGLYEKDVVDDSAVAPSFVYARDSGHFALGTSARAGKQFSRQCSFGVCFAPCPYTDGTVVASQTSAGLISCSSQESLNTTVPSILQDIYSSGTKLTRTTVSNFFDIEWRQTSTQYSRLYNNGSDDAPAGTFRQLQSFALEDGYVAVEGLVVDAKHGGVGFRNHTIPVGMPRGARWSEDLLFIEPDVECVNQNISLDFSISTSLGSNTGMVSMADLMLTDRGGFTNINTTYPVNDTRDGINKPDLKMRAYQAAWNINRFSMFTLNVTNPRNLSTGMEPFQYINSHVGKQFKLPLPDVGLDAYQSLGFMYNFGEIFGFNGYSTDGTIEDLGDIENPWNLTSYEWIYAREFCGGTLDTSPTLLNSTYVACNLVRGVPRRTDGGSSILFEDKSTWSSPLYACASSVRATIKTVTFFHNGTADNLDNLQIEEIKDKEYNNKDDMPLWGVEDWHFELGDWKPIWGLVHDKFEGFQNVSTVRQPWFYMLGTSNGLSGLNFYPMQTLENLPAGIAPLAAMNTIMETSAVTSSSDSADITAAGSMGLWLRWRELSGSADSMPTIFKLLWTDVAASALVGTKGVLGEGNAGPGQLVEIHVNPTVHRVLYNYAFGIPAFVTAFCLLLVLLLVCFSLITGRASLRIMDQRLKQTSLGRSLTTLNNPESSSFIMSSTDWNKANGHRYMDLGFGRGSGGQQPVGQEPQQSGVQLAGPLEHLYTSLDGKTAPPVASVRDHGNTEYHSPVQRSWQGANM